jgi:excisionase family DNA binding protein
MERNNVPEMNTQSASAPSPYDVLNAADVAAIMRCGKRKVQKMVAVGKLPMRRWGGRLIITRKRLEEFLDEGDEG